MSARTVGAVMIVDTPLGEAPLEVRRAFVGLELPLPHSKPVHYPGPGVLTGPRKS